MRTGQRHGMPAYPIGRLEHFRLTFARRFDLGIGAFRRVVLAAQNAGPTNHDVLAARRNPRGRTPRYRRTLRENALTLADAEADLQPDLVVGHLAAQYMTPGFGDLEPVHVADRLGAFAQGIVDRILDADLRGAHDFDFLVGVMIGHRSLLRLGRYRLQGLSPTQSSPNS